MSVDPTSALRSASLRAVFAALVEHGSVSRAQLARLTGLSKQTTSDIARTLEAANWIRCSGQTSGALGRRATTYTLDERSAPVLGVDLGGTKVRVAVAGLLGAVFAEDVAATHRDGGLHVVDQIRDLARAVAAKADLKVGAIRIGVVGTPGVVDATSGRIALAPNIPGLDRHDIAGALREALGFPVVVENDVNLAALGESLEGAQRNAGDLAFVALGTGVGMGIVSNGALMRGARGRAGEIAYLPIGGDAFDSRFWRFGTLESAIGSVAILERFRSRGGHAADVREVFARVADGDPAAAATLDDVARILAEAVLAIHAMLDPTVIVLGGSIGARPELIARVKAAARPLLGDDPAIEPSFLGARAGLIGAVGLAVTMLHRWLLDRDRPPAAPRRPAPRDAGVATADAR